MSTRCTYLRDLSLVKVSLLWEVEDGAAVGVQHVVVLQDAVQPHHHLGRPEVPDRENRNWSWQHANHLCAYGMRTAATMQMCHSW